MKKFYEVLESHKDVIYLVHLLVFIFAYIMGDNTVFAIPYKQTFTLIKYYALAMVFFKILFFDWKHYTFFTKIRLFLLILFLTVVMIVNDNRYLFQLFLLIIGAKNVDFKRIVKDTFFLEMVLVGSIVMLAMLGVLDNTISNREFGTVRNALGFKYPPSSSGYVWSLTLLYCYIKNGKLCWYEYFGLFFLNVIFYFLTDSRNGFLCSIVLLFLTFLYHFFQEKKLFSLPIHFFAKIMMVFLAAGSLFLTLQYYYKDPFYMQLDSIFSNRLGLQRKAYNQYSIKMFGSKVKWVSTDDIYRGVSQWEDLNYVDNSYIQLLIEYGLVFFFFLIIMISCIIWKNQKENKLYSNILWLVLFVHALIDPHLLKISMNIFLLQYVDFLIGFRKQKIN